MRYVRTFKCEACGHEKEYVISGGMGANIHVYDREEKHYKDLVQSGEMGIVLKTLYDTASAKEEEDNTVSCSFSCNNRLVYCSECMELSVVPLTEMSIVSWDDSLSEDYDICVSFTKRCERCHVNSPYEIYDSRFHGKLKCPSCGKEKSFFEIIRE